MLIYNEFTFSFLVYVECDSSLIQYKEEKLQQRVVLNPCVFISVWFWHNDRAPYAGAGVSLPLYLHTTQAAHRISCHLCSSSFSYAAAFYPMSHQLPVPGCFTRSGSDTQTDKYITEIPTHTCEEWCTDTQALDREDSVWGQVFLSVCHNRHIRPTLMIHHMYNYEVFLGIQSTTMIDV